ncbi:50S ribosomal protein L1, partial [bacterium]
MQIDLQRLTALVDEAKGNSQKRNFTQAVELVANFRSLDVKAPENRINETVVLS